MNRVPRMVLFGAAAAMLLASCASVDDAARSAGARLSKLPPVVSPADNPTTEVEVVVEKQAQDDGLLQQIVVEKTQDGDRVTLRVRGPANTQHDGLQIGIIYSPTARLRVAVPKATALDLRSGDGSITVEDVTGQLTLRTEDGSVSGLRLAGDVRVRTDDGSIRLRETTGKVDIETLDGSVTVTGQLTHLRAKSCDGSVPVTAEKGSALGDDWSVETNDGRSSPASASPMRATQPSIFISPS